MFKTALAGWLWRRLWDWGGHIGTWIAALSTLWSIMPPNVQAVVGKAATGHWGEITLAAAGPAAIWLISQVFSLKATTKPQVVNEKGVKADLDALPPTTKVAVNAQTEIASKRKKPNLLDRILGSIMTDR